MRLIDNIMDGHSPESAKYLPILQFLHSEFQSPYNELFPARHPFWGEFSRLWYTAADVTLHDSEFSSVTEEDFVSISGKKTCAAKIPVTATCFVLNRPDLIEPWCRAVDLFGCWHQMKNDALGWDRDLQAGTSSYFLSVANQRKSSSETAVEWIIREGLLWAFEKLGEWMGELTDAAGRLESRALANYLAERRRMANEQVETMSSGLRESSKFMSMLRELKGN